MAKKSSKSEPTARVKIRNKPGQAPVNVFPEGDTLDLEKLGGAGVRIAVERTLGHLHDFGDGIWLEIGVDKRKLRKYKAQAVDVLRRITLDANASRRMNRSGGMVLFAELGGNEALKDLTWVLESEAENTATRGWAAWAIGRLGGDHAARALISGLDSDSRVMRRYLVEALGETKSGLAVEALGNTAKYDKDPAVASLAFDRVRDMEKVLGMEPMKLKDRTYKARKRKVETEVPVD